MKKVFLLSSFLASSLLVFATASPVSPSWSETPFLLQAEDRFLDTNTFDRGGHAAPFLIDLDRDGWRDLVVGSIAGNFHFYRNTGTNAAPQFEGKYKALMAEGEPAKITNWCCMAVGPQFVDLDGDGIRDLTAGSYGGPVYWFKGLGGLEFKLAHQLLTWNGVTLVAHPETFLELSEDFTRIGKADSYAANISWAKWNDDASWDLILGNNLGELFVWQSYGRGEATDYSPKGLEVFNIVNLERNRKVRNEILINGQKVLPGDNLHSAPAVADWDGDGLWDILVGSKNGDVYLLRNTGKPGAPEFRTRELLIDGGRCFQMIERPDGAPEFGIRTQIHIADFNGDEKPDLLVGCFSLSVTPRVNLTDIERKEMLSIWTELEALDTEVGNRHHEIPTKFAGYHSPQNKARLERVTELMRRLGGYLKASGGAVGGQEHGNVWVFLRK